MDLISQFEIFARHFDSSTPIFTAPIQTQYVHAQKIQEWLQLTEKTKDFRSINRKTALELLESALKSVKNLFNKGDDITAWIGQTHIAEAAERLQPGVHAAYHLGWAAKFSIYMSLQSECEEFLDRMQSHFRESNHPIAAEFWTLKGVILRMQHRWMDAIPYFHLSIEHIERSSLKEINQWFEETREDLISNRLQLLADCYINLGWRAPKKDRPYFIKQAGKYLDKSRSIAKIPLEQALSSLNDMELKLLEGKMEEVRRDVVEFLGKKIINSTRAVTFRPAAYCMLARIAEQEGDINAIIANLSRALAESTLFPHAFQETVIIDFALDLIHHHSVNSEQSEQLFHAMVIMLEAKDWYTGHGHSKSVAEYAKMIWERWKPEPFDPRLEKKVYWAGYLHDIGKIRLPRSLLNKIAPLTEVEWKLIQRHPAYGKEILDNFDIDHLSDLVEEHHQNAEGTGYPGNHPASSLGLCIAIADIIEAATSPFRKYKMAKTLDDVILEIKDKGSSKYPLDLVQAAEKLTLR